MTDYSDEDVETAARILYERAMRPTHAVWSSAPNVVRDFFRDDARAVLDAVAPRIAERAWDEGYKAATAPRDLPRNPYAQDEATP